MCGFQDLQMDSLGSPAMGVTVGDVSVATERVGVLLLNLGGPETLDDVRPFLYNLFADPDIIRLPSGLGWLQKPLATLVSSLRAPKVLPPTAEGRPIPKQSLVDGYQAALPCPVCADDGNGSSNVTQAGFDNDVDDESIFLAVLEPTLKREDSSPLMEKHIECPSCFQSVLLRL